MQLDSRLHFSDVAISSRLGGQYGEEAKEQDEVGSEEDGAQDEAQGEEEVDFCLLQRSSALIEVETASHEPARVKREQHHAIAV